MVFDIRDMSCRLKLVDRKQCLVSKIHGYRLPLSSLLRIIDFGLAPLIAFEILSAVFEACLVIDIVAFSILDMDKKRF